MLAGQKMKMEGRMGDLLVNVTTASAKADIILKARISWVAWSRREWCRPLYLSTRVFGESRERGGSVSLLVHSQAVGQAAMKI